MIAPKLTDLNPTNLESTALKRKIVITGVGQISPLGNTKQSLWDALKSHHSGVSALKLFTNGAAPIHVGGAAEAFSGEIDDFGPLDKEQKKAVRKGIKLMCRECQMGVAAAQLAMTDAGITLGSVDPQRTGISFGTEYMLSAPDEFNDGIQLCTSDQGEFEFSRWGQEGLKKMSPLWLLKYLPNMPASHLAIYNDLRGPNNSITLREAGANLAVGEAFEIIRRGHADVMICGAAGTRLHVMKIMHSIQQEDVSKCDGDPCKVSRPFDKHRSGMVLGEGAGAIVIETLDHATARGATIYGEVIATASRASALRNHACHRKHAMANVLRALLRSTSAEDVGHINAHGLSTKSCDAEEAQAIAEVFGERASRVPVVALKSYFGNLGAGSGMVELIASLLAMQQGRLFTTLNYDHPDAECPVNVVVDDATPAGDSFINLSVTPQGQASGLLVRRM